MTLLVGSIFHMTRKIVSEMTYNVSMGTLNPTIPYHTIPQVYMAANLFNLFNCSLFMLLVCGIIGTTDSTERDDDAFGEFLSGLPDATVSLQSSVSQVSAMSAAESGSPIQDNGATGDPAPVKQSQTG